jgi:hypothetical protein
MYGICGGGYFACQASHLERVSSFSFKACVNVVSTLVVINTHLNRLNECLLLLRY